MPRLPAVGADLDQPDGGLTRPGPAAQHGGVAGHQVGGSVERALHRHPVEDGPVAVPALAVHAVPARVPRRVRDVRGHPELAEPLDAGDPDPAGDNQSRRVPVVPRQGAAVHVPGDQDVVEGLGDRQRSAYASVVLTLVDVRVVEADPHHLHGIVEQAGMPQHGRQRHAGPAGRPDRAEAPLGPWARCALLLAEQAPAVAGALQGAVVGAAGERLQLVQGVRRVPDHAVPAHQEPPRARVDHGRLRVVADVEPLGGGEVGDVVLPHGLHVGPVLDERVPHGMAGSVAQHALTLLN